MAIKEFTIKEFTVGFSRTINLGNYESARVEASVTFEVENYDADRSDEFDPIVREAQTELRNLLVQTWKAQSQTVKKDNGK